MKIRVWPLLIVLCAGLGLQPAARAAAVSFSAGIQVNAVADFYSPLQPYGTWVDVGSYGRCFRPTHVEAGWRPYTMGHWEYTDVGWYWMSEEPFGWATFHYGSWVNDPQYGWVWLPGTEWSPAWVTWRESDSYIGWAPCGPNLAVAAPSFFVFVNAGHFCDPIRPNTVIVNNTTVINNTRVVNNFRSETRSFDGGQHRMRVNHGPDVTRVQHATGRNFTPTPITTAVERTNMRRSNEQPGRERSATTPEQQPSRERSATTPEQRTREQNRERSTTTPEQQSRERSVTTPEQQTREHSATTPQQPAVQEPSGATRESKPSTRSHEAPAPSAPRESTAPSAPREAPAPTPAPQKPAIHEPSGARREAPTPSTQVPREAPVPAAPQQEHRTVAPHEAPQGPVLQQERGNGSDRGNGNDRRHDQP